MNLVGKVKNFNVFLGLSLQRMSCCEREGLLHACSQRRRASCSPQRWGDAAFEPAHGLAQILQGAGVAASQIAFVPAAEVHVRRHAHAGLVEDAEGGLHGVRVKVGALASMEKAPRGSTGMLKPRFGRPRAGSAGACRRRPWPAGPRPRRSKGPRCRPSGRPWWREEEDLHEGLERVRRALGFARQPSRQPAMAQALEKPPAAMVLSVNSSMPRSSAPPRRGRGRSRRRPPAFPAQPACACAPPP